MWKNRLCGLDLGTFGCKGALVTTDGRVWPPRRRSLPTRRPEPGSAEQDPEDWFTSFSWVTLELAQAVGAERWQAIACRRCCPRWFSQTAPVPPPPPAVPVPPTPRWARSRA